MLLRMLYGTVIYEETPARFVALLDRLRIQESPSTEFQTGAIGREPPRA
jgi:hypothetical protein